MKALVEMENSGLVPMLRDDKFDDLGRMYQLLRKVDGGANLIRSVMSDYVKEIGKQLVQDPEKCKVRPPSACWPMHAVDEFSGPILEGTLSRTHTKRPALLTRPLQDPVEFVQKLIDEREKYERIVTQSFGDDKTFRSSLNLVRLNAHA